MTTFNHTKNFICECGKEFVNSQSFNGHKCHCKIHQVIKHGSLDYINQVKSQSAKKFSAACAEKRKIREEEKRLIWISEKHTCEKCGKIMAEKFGSGRFCSWSCANSRVLSTEIKIKISKSSVKTTGGKSKYDLQFCKDCGKVLSRRNQTGYCFLCNLKSSALRERRVIAGKKAYKTMIEHDTHHGWQTRDQISYAEQFWIKVLNNNNISYTHEYSVRKADGINNYFLDFYIEIGNTKLDLEIDGKQHKYKDRHQSDIERDTYLTSLGYTVYRIDWNEISSEKGKAKMKEKIDTFLKYYNGL